MKGVAVTDLLTAILTVITGVYAFLTWRILKSNEAVVAVMREQREAASRPQVTIATFTLPKDIRIYLRVENTGPTAARNVRLTLDRPFHRHARAEEAQNLQSYPAFKQTIDSLGPGMRLQFTLGTGINLFAAEANRDVAPLTFAVKTRYEWDGHTADETTLIDLRPYLQSEVVSDPLVDEVKKIRETLERKG